MRGIASTIVIFVLAAVIFVVAVWFLLSKVFPNILYQLEKLLGIVKPTPIESAIMCSIARCKYGCNSFRVRDIGWVDYDDSGRKINVNCWEKFCSGTSPDVYSEGDKICEKMPVNITLRYPQKISIEHLSDVTEGEDTQLQTVTGLSFGVGFDPLWVFRFIGNAIEKFTKTTYIISLPEDRVVSKGDGVDCITAQLGIPLIPVYLNAAITGCYKSLEINSGKYQITTASSRKLIITGPPIYATTILNITSG
jgi:hypothetical protein